MARNAGLVLVSLVALLHIYFLVMEMFLWQTPRVRAGFGMTDEFAKDSATLAKNQGLYNGFLAAGLTWGMLLDGSQGFDVRVFFLTCVVVAGVYGGLTASRRILVAQALPGAIALAVTLLAG